MYCDKHALHLTSLIIKIKILQNLINHTGYQLLKRMINLVGVQKCLHVLLVSNLGGFIVLLVGK